MTDLGNAACEACSKDAPTLAEDEISRLRTEVPDWNVLERKGEKQLERQFKFRNFAQALSFANRVGEIAELEKHHPALLVEWGKVTVTWWTHKIGGLHRNDFIMAVRTDALYEDA